MRALRALAPIIYLAYLDLVVSGCRREVVSAGLVDARAWLLLHTCIHSILLSSSFLLAKSVRA